MSQPSSRMEPALTVSMVEMQLSSVVLPEPGGDGEADVVDGAGHPAAVAIDFLDMLQTQQFVHVNHLPCSLRDAGGNL